MTACTYIFGDLLTGQIITEIPLYGVSMTKGMATAEFRASFQLDQTGQQNSTLLDATIPGRCYVVCERAGVPVWAGIVWTRTYQSQAKVHQLYCRGFEAYPDKRIITEDILYTNVEQLNIFRELWLALMADANSIQLTLPAVAPDVTLKTLDIKASEFRTYRQAMDDLANTDDGFDWTVDVVRAENAYSFIVRVGFPLIGTQNVESAVFLDYPGSITNYWQNESMADTGTHIYALGGGEGSTMLSVEVIHDDLIESNHPRYDTDVSFKDISDPNVLTPLAIQAANIRKAPGTTLTVECKADKFPIFGEYGIGDLAVITLQDPKHPNREDQIKQKRILGWEYYPSSSDTVEYARLVFEGDDL
jgi:hypothetical protein